MIRMAYGVQPYQISGPDWMETQRFDVTAQLPEGVSGDRMPALLQVSRRTTEPDHQKISQVLLGFHKVAVRIHRAQQVVLGNLPIKRIGKALESELADG